MEIQMTTLALLAFLSAVTTVYAQEFQVVCPLKYLRYSLTHSYCLAPCCSCPYYKKGLSNDLKNYIVYLHNSFRSKVAGGHPSGVNHLSRATNMLEMIWDDELADIAQKWASTCPLGKQDCSLCRTIDKFPLGQIVLEYDKGEMNDRVIQRQFDNFFHGLENMTKEQLSSYHEADGKGQHTQLLWAKTWRIGCGYLYYHGSNGQNISTLVCNYGPTGNIEGDETYKPGCVCSQCPGNSCCDNDCKKYGVEAKYKGLCKVIDPKYPPEGYVPHNKTRKEIFYCNFNGESDCDYIVVGIKSWQSIKTLGGSFLHTILQSNQISILHFMTPIISKSGNLCIKIVTRKGPVEIGADYDHQMYAALVKQGNYKKGITFPRLDQKTMHTYQVDYIQPEGYPKKTDGIRFSLSFSVPEGAGPQYFDLIEIVAEKRKCKHVTTVTEDVI